MFTVFCYPDVSIKRIFAIIRRDLILALRRRSEIANPLLFLFWLLHYFH